MNCIVAVDENWAIGNKNELLVRRDVENEYGQFMYFEVLTYVPFDLDAVDVTLLNSKEKQLLNDYHSRVYNELSAYMTEEELVWLKTATRAI